MFLKIENMIYIVFLYLLFLINAELQPNGRHQFIYDYAPQIYFDKNEEYYASSIDYFSNFTHLEIINAKLWTISNTKLVHPSGILPYFQGQKVAPVYAMVLPALTEPNPVQAMKDPRNANVVVTYYTFYPYNRGKIVINTVWDNHIGDIEHGHIFFNNSKPYKIVLSYHAWNVSKIWTDPSISKNNTHSIWYSALGSHGLWFNNGTHIYHNNPILKDETSQGRAWYTWKNLIVITPFDWPKYIQYNTTWITNIWRWGDSNHDFPIDNCYFGFCRFSNGPTGFLDKLYVRTIIKKLKSKGLICSKNCIWDSGIF